jgi:uncharacterized protein (TIGR02117 family)
MVPNDSKRNGKFRLPKQVAKWFGYVLLIYLAILLIGLIPVNNGFESPGQGIELLVVSNAVHADIIVPKTTDVIDWSETFQEFEFIEDTSNLSHVGFGWGDRGFFLETPNWDDLKVSTAANALLIPSGSCIHVNFTRGEYFPEATTVAISRQQYKRLVELLLSSFAKDNQSSFQQIDGYAYSTNDAFFDARGNYHLLNTCNSWVGRALKSAGVRVPLLSPLPKTPMMYIDSD